MSYHLHILNIVIFFYASLLNCCNSVVNAPEWSYPSGTPAFRISLYGHIAAPPRGMAGLGLPYTSYCCMITFLSLTSISILMYFWIAWLYVCHCPKITLLFCFFINLLLNLKKNQGCAHHDWNMRVMPDWAASGDASRGLSQSFNCMCCHSFCNIESMSSLASCDLQRKPDFLVKTTTN